MKDETKQKIVAKLILVKEKAKENLPKIIFWTGVCGVIHGAKCGIEAKHEIRQHRKWTNEVEVPTFNRNVDISNGNYDKFNERFNDLERQVNTLLGKALEETEGKESA